MFPGSSDLCNIPRKFCNVYLEPTSSLLQKMDKWQRGRFKTLINEFKTINILTFLSCPGTARPHSPAPTPPALVLWIMFARQEYTLLWLIFAFFLSLLCIVYVRFKHKRFNLKISLQIILDKLNWVNSQPGSRVRFTQVLY